MSSATKLENVPEGQLKRFAKVLGRQPALLGKVTVKSGAKALADLDSPPRIVIVPDNGDYTFPGDKSKSFTDVDLECVAACWANTDDELEYLRTLLFEALEQQESAVIPDDEPDAGEPDSRLWAWLRERWQTGREGADQTLGGCGLEIYIRVRLSADRPPARFGLVNETTLTEEA